MKLIRESNLLTVRERVTRKVSHHVDPVEKRAVLSRINETAYYLYDHYRTGFFADASDISDEVIGETIGWPTRKVGKYRVELQKADLIRIIKIGSSNRAITKLIVGMDRVALSDAGLPDSIQDSAALRRIKKSLNINSPLDLVSNIKSIQQRYEEITDGKQL
ncbi:hypothetical protein [Marinobacterium litorale]|uniref:hypothetical protein n=1 Tax=Marinobacterium litorale TaxID=404770 RepID=UPI000481FCFF|nr:hypothetical protein [Marinobacterium litorale]